MRPEMLEETKGALDKMHVVDLSSSSCCALTSIPTIPTILSRRLAASVQPMLQLFLLPGTT